MAYIRPMLAAPQSGRKLKARLKPAATKPAPKNAIQNTCHGIHAGVSGFRSVRARGSGPLQHDERHNQEIATRVAQPCLSNQTHKNDTVYRFCFMKLVPRAEEAAILQLAGRRKAAPRILPGPDSCTKATIRTFFGSVAVLSFS
jgi:hypothetical protein